MIPKIIHYCWFGGKVIPKDLQKLMSTWTILKGYKIIRWDESNSEIENSPYLKNAYDNKKWANISNYVRLTALKQYGGVYLDTDIEIIKPFDHLLDQKAFVGFEDKHIDWSGCINNAVLGAEAGHWFIDMLQKELLQQFDGLEEAHLSSPNLTTACLKNLGLIKYGDQMIKDIHVYSTDFFYPYSWHEIFTPERVTENTYCIHHFQQSWAETKKKQKIKFWVKKNYHLLRWKWIKWKKRIF